MTMAEVNQYFTILVYHVAAGVKRGGKYLLTKLFLIIVRVVMRKALDNKSRLEVKV